MTRGLRGRFSPRKFLSRGRYSILIILVIVFLIADGVFGWYIVSYSVADKAVQEVELEQDILQLECSHSDLILVRFQDSVGMVMDTTVELEFSGSPVDMALGDDSNAVAVLTENDTIHYFPPGQIAEQFYIELDGAVALIGIAEQYSSTGYNPLSIIAIATNDSGDSAHVLSIETRETIWTYDFEGNVTDFTRSDNTGYFSVVIDGRKVIHFAQFSSTPRMTYDFDTPVDEVQLSGSGTAVVVLYDLGTKLSRFTTTSSGPVWTANLPEGSSDLQLRNKATYSYVKLGKEVFVIEDGVVGSRIQVEEMITYTVPTVIDKIYISIPGELWGYKGTRTAPNWVGPTPVDIENLKTDTVGYTIIGWSERTIVQVNDSDMPLGNDALWIILGFLLIGQVALLMIYSWLDKLMGTRKETLYVMVAGAIAGILVAYILPDQSAIDWFGMGSYIILAGTMAAIATHISWRTEAGLANIVVGLVMGIILAVPLALLAHFLMEVGGYHFADSSFYSIANLAYTGLKMGLVGGVVGYVAQKLIRT